MLDFLLQQPHSAVSTSDLISKFGWTTLPHHPNSHLATTTCRGIQDEI